MSARPRARALLAALPIPGLAAALCALSSAAGAGILSVPVKFDVVNQNRTDLACDSDNGIYEVRGHLTGHRALLEGPGPLAVTLYTYGFDGGEWNWRLQAVPGYDQPAELAERAHLSVSIDMLGYDASGHPDGFQSCMGSQADVHHQIVDQLRDGLYTVLDGSIAAPEFDTVVLAGHDVSGGMVELQAYNWPDDADGLLLVTWADQGLGPIVFERAAAARQVCAEGGEPAEDDDPSSPGGYHFFGPDDPEFADQLLAHAEPDVVDAVLALRNRNPCGYNPSIIPMLNNNQQRSSEIEVPVLLMLGEDDPVFLQPGWAAQQFAYGPGAEVESILIPDASHFPMLETSAPVVHDEISRWLCDHDFVSAAADAVCGLPEPGSLLGLAAGLALLGPLARRRGVGR